MACGMLLSSARVAHVAFATGRQSRPTGSTEGPGSPLVIPRSRQSPSRASHSCDTHPALCTQRLSEQGGCPHTMARTPWFLLPMLAETCTCEVLGCGWGHRQDRGGHRDGRGAQDTSHPGTVIGWRS